MEKLPENMALDADRLKEFKETVKAYKAKGKLSDSGTEETGVVYIGHIPQGFYEEQMRCYFSQFGKVKRLKLSRSKRTGRSKGYAFIEFASKYTAKTVAECMNNYLMFHRLLKCEEVPKERLHPDTFKDCTRKFRKPKAIMLARNRHNKKRSASQQRKTGNRLVSRKKKGLSRLAAAGIQYDLTGVIKKDSGVKK